MDEKSIKDIGEQPDDYPDDIGRFDVHWHFSISYFVVVHLVLWRISGSHFRESVLSLGLSNGADHGNVDEHGRRRW